MRLPDDLLPAAVYAFVVFDCLSDVPELLAQAIERRWRLDESQFDSLRIRSYPTLITNLIASHACYERFGDRLRLVEGFYCCDGAWRMDLDPGWSSNGFVMPQRNEHGWFSRLRAFRGPSDEWGFPVRVRKAAA